MWRHAKRRTLGPSQGCTEHPGWTGLPSPGSGSGHEAMLMELTEPVVLAMESQRRSASAAAKHRRFLELLQPLPGEHILDVGCGTGAFCREVASLVAPDGYVIGIDLVTAAVEVAKRL